MFWDKEEGGGGGGQDELGCLIVFVEVTNESWELNRHILLSVSFIKSFIIRINVLAFCHFGYAWCAVFAAKKQNTQRHCMCEQIIVVNQN